MNARLHLQVMPKRSPRLYHMARQNKRDGPDTDGLNPGRNRLQLTPWYNRDV